MLDRRSLVPINTREQQLIKQFRDPAADIDFLVCILSTSNVWGGIVCRNY